MIRKRDCQSQMLITAPFRNERGCKKTQNGFLHPFDIYCGSAVKPVFLKCRIAKPPGCAVFRYIRTDWYHSHSIVAGGFPVISYTTLPTPLTSFTILDETLPRSLCESGAYSQVIKSVVLTARSATV